MPTLIDLSVPLISGAAGEPVIPGRSPPKIDYHSHEDTTEFVEKFFDVDRKQLSRGHGWASESVLLSTHSGTHCDAPYHFSPVTDRGATRSMTIDEVPLDWYYGPGVILDFSAKKAEEPILASDVEAALRRINYQIKPNDIVLFRTDAYKLWPSAAYQTDFPGITKEAALCLIDKGVRVMGVDAYNFDMPFPTQRRMFKETGDASVIEPCHWELGYEKNYCHIEKLANLDKVPRPFGFTVSALPVKVSGASAGWCRAVAIIED